MSATVCRSSVDAQERLIMDNVNKDIILSKSDIAKRCNVTPQNINYIYNKMVKDGKIPDYYKSAKKKQSEEIKKSRKPAPTFRKEALKSLRTFKESDFIELGFGNPYITELVQDMENSYRDPYEDYM